MNEKIEFEILEERQFGQATLECPACGFVFDIDAYTQENLIWDKKQKAQVAQCPICQRVQR